VGYLETYLFCLWVGFITSLGASLGNYASCPFASKVHCTVFCDALFRGKQWIAGAKTLSFPLIASFRIHVGLLHPSGARFDTRALLGPLLLYTTFQHLRTSPK